MEMLNPKELKNDEFQYESYFSSIKNCILFQADYRTPEGVLFSAVGKSLNDAKNKIIKQIEKTNNEKLTYKFI